MALNYPGFVAPQPTSTTLLDVLGAWNKGEAEGTALRQEREAPDAFVKSAAPLSEFGLSAPPEELRALFANPNTRPMAIQMVQEATARRADANDPLKQLQLKKAQLDLAKASQPAAPADPFANAPAAVREYVQYRAFEKEAGREPVDFLTFKNGPTEGVKPLTDVAKLKSDLDAGLITQDQYDAAVSKELAGSSGLSVTTNPDGTVSVTQGGTTMPKLTEGQSKDTVFVTRATGALPTLDELGNKLTSLGESVAGNVPYGQYAQSEDYQKADQAAREFLAAILRKDTGAAVTDSEMANYGRTYIPQPGDKPGNLEQKRIARARAVKAISLGLPPQAVLALESEGVVIPELDGGAAPPATGGDAPPAGWSGDPSLWQFLTQEERKLWQN